MTYTGSKRPAGYVPLKILAQAMRADIKEAIKAGTLPGRVSDYGVRTETYAGGGSINIIWKDNNHWIIERDSWGEDVEVLDDLGVQVDDVLRGIHNDYNYDASDIQVDYFNTGYYGGVEVINAAGTYPVRARNRRF